MPEPKAAVRNAADPNQVRSAKKREEFRRESELLNLQTVLSLPAGRALLWSLLTRCGVARTSFSSDALVMAKNEGQRNIGLMLQADIMEANAKAYLLMQKEANQLDDNLVEPPGHQEESE